MPTHTHRSFACDKTICQVARFGLCAEEQRASLPERTHLSKRERANVCSAFWTWWVDGSIYFTPDQSLHCDHTLYMPRFFLLCCWFEYSNWLSRGSCHEHAIPNAINFLAFTEQPQHNKHFHNKFVTILAPNRISVKNIWFINAINVNRFLGISCPYILLGNDFFIQFSVSLSIQHRLYYVRQSAALHVNSWQCFWLDLVIWKEFLLKIKNKTVRMHDSVCTLVISVHLSAHDHYNCFFLSLFIHLAIICPLLVRCYVFTHKIIEQVPHTWHVASQILHLVRGAYTI